DLKLGVGDQLATSFGGVANGLARIIGLINSNPQAIAELKSLPFFGGSGITSQADIETAARGVTAKDVFGAVGAARFQRKSDLGGASFDVRQAQINALDALPPRLLKISLTSEEAKGQILQLLNTFGQTGNLQAFVDGLSRIEGAGQRG